jgi:ABC-2 type transport system permease protein
MNLIKSEFYKLKVSKSFTICLLVCAGLAVFIAIALNMGVAGRAAEDFEAIAETISAVTFLELTLGLGFLPTLFAIFVSLFTAGEFHNGTMKNYVSRGFNRVQIYLAKFTVSGIAILAMLAVNILFSCVIGILFWGFDPYSVATIGSLAIMLFGVGLLMLAYSSVFVFVSMWLRNIGATVAVNVGLVFLFSSVLMAINYIIGGSLTLSDYWLTDSITALASLSPENGIVQRGIIVGLCYLVGSTVLGSILFKTQDIR